MDRSCAFLRVKMRRTPSACVRSLSNESPGVEAIDRAPVVRGEFERRDGPKPELVPTESARTPCHWRGTESRKQRRVRGRSLIITVGPLWHCPRSNGKKLPGRQREWRHSSHAGLSFGPEPLRFSQSPRPEALSSIFESFQNRFTA